MLFFLITSLAKITNNLRKILHSGFYQCVVIIKRYKKCFITFYKHITQVQKGSLPRLISNELLVLVPFQKLVLTHLPTLEKTTYFALSDLDFCDSVFALNIALITKTSNTKFI